MTIHEMQAIAATVAEKLNTLKIAEIARDTGEPEYYTGNDVLRIVSRAAWRSGQWVDLEAWKILLDGGEIQTTYFTYRLVA